ncbi:hypothetical protein C8E03_11937 [Lachnotalea glycerini]|uniref:Uncharacterized protein n=1 Tax=Lachnotalea glycerini TaxID=1763509 RepID=A0A318ELP2_9FIRM|nr:hypothetical protein [Lachnotalea glycerini]PXV85113.1 hypothetical protein C8E03_11937 [Lachnotalea glycerini]
MYSVEDMKQCIQEWFTDCSDPIEVARTYAEIEKETEKQLVFMLDTFTVSNEK